MPHDMEATCPHCGKLIDGVTHVSGEINPSIIDDTAMPKDGDIGICFYCANPMCRTAAGSWRKLSVLDYPLPSGVALALKIMQGKRREN